MNPVSVISINIRISCAQPRSSGNRHTCTHTHTHTHTHTCAHIHGARIVKSISRAWDDFIFPRKGCLGATVCLGAGTIQRDGSSGEVSGDGRVQLWLLQHAVGVGRHGEGQLPLLSSRIKDVSRVGARHAHLQRHVSVEIASFLSLMAHLYRSLGLTIFYPFVDFL